MTKRGVPLDRLLRVAAVFPLGTFPSRTWILDESNTVGDTGSDGLVGLRACLLACLLASWLVCLLVCLFLCSSICSFVCSFLSVCAFLNHFVEMGDARLTKHLERDSHFSRGKNDIAIFIYGGYIVKYCKYKGLCLFKVCDLQGCMV